MRSQPNGRSGTARTYRAVASALSAIPVPLRVKERRRGPIPVSEHIRFSDVPVTELIAAMGAVESRPEDFRGELLAALAVLESLGVVTLERLSTRAALQPGDLRVAATSEPAGYLLRSLSRYMAGGPQRRPPIRPDSNLKGFRSVIKAALEQDKLNPHLVLANLLELGRKDASDDPLRSVRVISVLIKGEQTRPDSDTEPLYLHVKKPDWDSYALIGSVQGMGEDDEYTARLALDEDLETPAHLFELRCSGVPDEHDVELSVTRGVHTRYAFNVFIVRAVHGELRFREDLEYDWFSLDEVCAQESGTGERIITKAALLRSIDSRLGLASVPTIVSDPRPFLSKSLRGQLADTVRELRDVIRESRKLARLIWMGLLSLKWWLLLMGAALGSLLILRPLIYRDIPGLSNLADILGIVGFVCSLVAVTRKLRK